MRMETTKDGRQSPRSLLTSWSHHARPRLLASRLSLYLRETPGLFNLSLFEICVAQAAQCNLKQHSRQSSESARIHTKLIAVVTSGDRGDDYPSSPRKN
jgi:hypothetical protein